MLGESEKKEIYEFAKENGFDVIGILDKNKSSYVTEPDEFIFLVHYAEVVFTDSYHGTIFSIVFRKNIIKMERQDSLQNMESRFDTLYQKLGFVGARIIENRIVASDYSNVEINISRERKIANKYLEDII